MQLGTILTFRDDGARPHAEVVLRNGDRVHITLDGDGMTIVQIAGSANPQVLFEATPEVAAHICAGLVEAPRMSATPLRILTLTVIQIGSASEVRAAFKSAAAQVL